MIAPGDCEFAGSHECSPQIASQPCGDSFPQENLLMFRICQSRPSRPPPEHRAARGPQPRVDGPARRACVRSVATARFTWTGQQRRNSPGRNHPAPDHSTPGTLRDFHTTSSQSEQAGSTSFDRDVVSGPVPPEVHAVPRVEDRSNRNCHGFVVPQRVGKAPSSSWTRSASAGAPYSEIS